MPALECSAEISFPAFRADSLPIPGVVDGRAAAVAQAAEVDQFPPVVSEAIAKPNKALIRTACGGSL